jgi:hypothetical protein
VQFEKETLVDALTLTAMLLRTAASLATNCRREKVRGVVTVSTSSAKSPVFSMVGLSSEGVHVLQAKPAKMPPLAFGALDLNTRDPENVEAPQTYTRGLPSVSSLRASATLLRGDSLVPLPPAAASGSTKTPKSLLTQGADSRGSFAGSQPGGTMTGASVLASLPPLLEPDSALPSTPPPSPLEVLPPSPLNDEQAAMTNDVVAVAPSHRSAATRAPPRLF